MPVRKKLIEVALPLEAINKAAAREKSIRHGHPSTLHLWWARRPLAAARAVIFAQMVDDPSANPDLFPTVKKQEKERQRLFRLLDDLVQWENTNNLAVLQAARDEIWQSWRRSCAQNVDHPRAQSLFDRSKLPGFHDPFAGGGALPLEAQRLGLESHASDLNPVAVLLNKAMIEIPPRFAGRPPINPAWSKKSSREQMLSTWSGAQGLAHDVRHYGEWMRTEAEKRIGRLYPSVVITPNMTADRPDLQPFLGQRLTVIAWIWARTVKSPNPAFVHVDVPLTSTFMLSTKPGKEAYVEPVVAHGGYSFVVKVGKPPDVDALKRGTRAGKAQDFLCLMSGVPVPRTYVREQGKAGHLGARLMAIVAEGDRGRVYLSPDAVPETSALTATEVAAADEAKSTFLSGLTPTRAMITGGVCSAYGLSTWGSLFSSRQLVALTTFSDLVVEAMTQVTRDASASGFPQDDRPLRDGGLGSTAYAEAVAVYLALGVDRLVDRCSTLCGWDNGFTKIRNTFGRQALAMTWDFVEGNPFSESTGNFCASLEWVAKFLVETPADAPGYSAQSLAQSQSFSAGRVVSTDPPYYDNIAYADLSDFFYAWLRRPLRPLFPELFSTVSTPKAEELIATVYRHGTKQKAEAFFLDGMTSAMRRLAEDAHPAFPVTIYYAFKQSESNSDDGTASTGWDTFLAAVIDAGFAISGTWPMRTELGNRMIGSGANALASSIVLVCRKRNANSPSSTRRDFITALKTELPDALAQLQAGNIAPVDLAQAAIGPGMSVYTRYAKVVDAEGKSIPVREALGLINQVLDEALAAQEGDFDADSRWALAWFEEFAFMDGEYGRAETLSTAKNTSVQGLATAGILASKGGKVRLLRPEELPADWDPATDQRLTAWQVVHHLVRVLGAEGEKGAATIVAKLADKAAPARELAYRLYSICERKKRAQEALAYNALVQSWPEIARLAQESKPAAAPSQQGLFGNKEK